MKLLELTEPYFQYVCRLNRSARKGAPQDESSVRADLHALLSDMRGRALRLGPLATEYDRIEPALIFFADEAIRGSELPFASAWEPIGGTLSDPNAGRVFGVLVEEALRDKGPYGNERLGVLYTCLGLGFSGGRSPDELRRLMVEVSAKLRSEMDADPASAVCPEAYEHVDTTDLVQPAGRSVLAIVVVLAGLIVALFFINGYLYVSGTRDLRESLTAITAAEASAAGSQRSGGE
ncbi:MAG: DotU family type IV/VI secretion system protein [Phycisphaeraceae bacterium]|nr:DotU family type IV/VI secretion system protein [Phycisphaeraceae bacterium]